jgi:hypothetical protein
MSDAAAADRQAIREVIENWVLWRDAGNWEPSPPSGTTTAG